MLLTPNKSLRLAGGALETMSFLSLKLLCRSRHQWRAFSGRVFRQYMSLARQDKWLSRSIDEIFPEQRSTRLVLDYMTGEGIHTPADELVYLALATAAIKPGKIFEIGTFRGRTALNFALNTPEDCVIYTLDLPMEERETIARATNEADRGIIQRSLTGIDYQGKVEARKIRQLYGNSLSFDFRPYEGQMDLVFVDGAHHYEAALSDTRNALKLVSKRGVILWHDFANYGDYNDVTRAVLDLLPGEKVIQIDSSQLAIYRAAS
jgi:predicted O-methyltransferase YrrM